MSKEKQPRVQKTAQGRNRYDVDEYLDEKVSLFNISRCFRYLKKARSRLSTALILSIFGNLAGLMGPLFVMRALDVAVPAKDVKLLLTMALFLTISIVVAISLGAVRNVIVARAGANIIHDIRFDLFNHLQKLPFQFYDSRPHGKIFVRVVPYVNSVSDALSNGIINFVIEVLNIFFIIFFMFRVSPQLATITVLGLPILAAFIWYIKPRQRKAWQLVSNKNSNLNAYIQESIDGVKVTQAFDRQNMNLDIMNDLTNDRNRAWMRAQYISNTTWCSTETIADRKSVV